MPSAVGVPASVSSFEMMISSPGDPTHSFTGVVKWTGVTPIVPPPCSGHRSSGSVHSPQSGRSLPTNRFLPMMTHSHRARRHRHGPAHALRDLRESRDPAEGPPERAGVRDVHPARRDRFRPLEVHFELRRPPARAAPAGHVRGLVRMEAPVPGLGHERHRGHRLHREVLRRADRGEVARVDAARRLVDRVDGREHALRAARGNRDTGRVDDRHLDAVPHQRRPTGARELERLPDDGDLPDRGTGELLQAAEQIPEEAGVSAVVVTAVVVSTEVRHQLPTFRPRIRWYGVGGSSAFPSLRFRMRSVKRSATFSATSSTCKCCSASASSHRSSLSSTSANLRAQDSCSRAGTEVRNGHTWRPASLGSGCIRWRKTLSPSTFALPGGGGYPGGGSTPWLRNTPRSMCGGAHSVSSSGGARQYLTARAVPGAVTPGSGVAFWIRRKLQRDS